MGFIFESRVSFSSDASTDIIQLSLFQIACAIPFGNKKMTEHFFSVGAHLNDLKDRKISALAFLIASSIRLISLSVPAAFAHYAVAFAFDGWEFGFYLHTTLLATFFMLNIFQLGKIMALCTKDINLFFAAYLSYGALSLIFSGILAPSVNVHPDGMRIFMYLSIQYWSFSGTLVAWSSVVYANLDTSYFEENMSPIIASELAPRFLQYELLTNPKKSLLVLFFAFPFLSLIEYIILLGMTSSKKLNQYVTRKDAAEMEVENNEEEDEMEFDETVEMADS